MSWADPETPPCAHTTDKPGPGAPGSGHFPPRCPSGAFPGCQRGQRGDAAPAGQGWGRRAGSAQDRAGQSRAQRSSSQFSHAWRLKRLSWAGGAGSVCVLAPLCWLGGLTAAVSSRKGEDFTQELTFTSHCWGQATHPVLWNSVPASDFAASNERFLELFSENPLLQWGKQLRRARLAQGWLGVQLSAWAALALSRHSLQRHKKQTKNTQNPTPACENYRGVHRGVRAGSEPL